MLQDECIGIPYCYHNVMCPASLLQPGSSRPSTAASGHSRPGSAASSHSSRSSSQALTTATPDPDTVLHSLGQPLSATTLDKAVCEQLRGALQHEHAALLSDIELLHELLEQQVEVTVGGSL